MSKRISRAVFLKGLAALAATGVAGKLIVDRAGGASRKIPCRMLGPSFALGHRIRDRNALSGLKPGKTLNKKLTIVGGGIAGLSAGWWLKRNGFEDFVILELEKEVGGNSRAGKNDLGSFPWGAHYVPLANEESRYVREIFEEMGVITSRNPDGKAVYNDLYLCHDPQERLFKDGRFQEGLVPNRGLSPADRQEMARFFKTVRDFRKRIGRDGKPAFAIPVDLSSRDEAFTDLDRISMASWLEQEGYKSKPLLWYVRYCCRDDYGGNPDTVSAWAGIHYFAGRRGQAANAEQNSVVTWPEGNGFLVNYLRGKLEGHIMESSMVFRISQDEGAVRCSVLDADRQSAFAVLSEHMIFAAPRFIASHIIEGMTSKERPTYAPWLVANISLRFIPEGRGIEVAWDNVSYYSESLGYVVSSHQNITTRVQAPTVITYYYPLPGGAPPAERQKLLESTPEQWLDLIIADLEKMHPGIRELVTSVDLWPWGHGMVRPNPGFVWGDERRRMLEDNGRILFAHSDMSGISNFEEAQYRGVEAAVKVLRNGQRKS